MSVGFDIRIASSAMAEIEKASRWWRKNRCESPRLFDHELNTALDLLEVQPEIGATATHPMYGVIHVVVLRRSRYRVAYQIRETMRQVWIVQVRHTSRRPRLRSARSSRPRR